MAVINARVNVVKNKLGTLTFTNPFTNPMKTAPGVSSGSRFT